MPDCTAARADRFSAALARLALTCTVLLGALGVAAWIVRAGLPVWGWVCVWPAALASVLLLFLRTLTARTDPRLSGAAR